MTSILLYFDGLPASQRALDFAETLLKTTSGHLVLLYVRSQHLLHTPQPVRRVHTVGETERLILPVPEPAREAEMRHSLEVMERAREQLDAKGVRADYQIADGDLVDVIAGEAGKGYDLVICPVAAESAESSLISSDLQKLLSRVHCSVLVAR